MAKHGKSYNAAAEKIDRATLYTPLQAAKLIKDNYKDITFYLCVNM